MSGEEQGQGVGRRGFLKSIFGLGSVVEAPAVVAKPKSAFSQAKFFWADLHTGQVGFPTGQLVPAGLPGSLMKLVAAAALLDSDTLLPDQKFECRGSYRLHNETVHCLCPHGVLDMTHAIGLSCNVYFAQASKQLSPKKFLKYAASFGLDQPVASFPGGNYPHSPLPYALNYVLGLDPALAPSALQILRLVGLVARQGNLPYLHSAESPSALAGPFRLELSESSWRVLQQGMQVASREGTGAKLDPAHKLKVAIKTGTSPHGQTFQSWAAGYFPWEEPKYAFVVRAQSGTSQDNAIPAARSFLFANQWP